jgi:peptide/nickel transport system substrate-binding protein
MRIARRTVLAITLACAGSVGVPARADGPRQLRVAIGADIKTTENPTKHDAVTQMVLHHVVEGLVTYRDDMTVAPLLAESYETSDEGMTYRFRLREGLKFHNGKPVTAAAVKWAWERYLDPKVNWGAEDHCREIFDGSYEAFTLPVAVLGIDTPDERTVVFRLQSRNALFLHWMSSNYCISGIVDKESVNPDGSWNRPVGTGPFMLKEWKKGEYVELSRFAQYKPRAEPRTGNTGAKLAQVDSIRFVVMSDPARAKAALRAGEVDVWPRVPIDQEPDLKAAPEVKLHAHATPAWALLLLQTRSDPLLRDKRVRQAIAHAIDRERLVREAMSGRGVPNPSAVPVVTPYHTKAHDASLGYDPARARALLREAGYDGRRLTIDANRDVNPFFHDVAVVVEKMLREVGLNAEVQDLPWAKQSSRYGQSEYQISSFRYSMREPALIYSAVIGQKTDHKFFVWEDTEAALWVAQSAFAKTDAERQAIFDRLHARMLDATPVVGLFNLVLVDATRTNVRGYAPWAFGLARFWGVQKE